VDIAQGILGHYAVLAYTKQQANTGPIFRVAQLLVNEQ
jgi:hypothetical protein